jgi:hypothetical protein
VKSAHPHSLGNFADKCLNTLAHFTGSLVSESDRQNSHRVRALIN